MSDITPTPPTGAPLTSFPWRLTPYNNITPVTYRDGETLIEMYKNLRAWLFEELVPYIDSTFTEYVDAFNSALAQVDAAFEEVKTYFDGKEEEIDAKILAFNDAATAANVAFQAAVTAANNAFDTKVTNANATIDGKVTAASTSAINAAASAALAQQWAAATIALQDTAVKNLIQNTSSATYLALAAVIDSRGGGRFNVKTYGATGDGVTDDTQAFKQALAAAQVGKGSVWVPAGRFIVGDLLAPLSGDVVIDGIGTLVQASDTVPLFRTVNGQGEIVTANPAGDYSVGSSLLPINSYQNNLSKDDYVVIYDGYSYDPTYAPNVSGEIAQVLAASSTQILLKNNLMGSFYDQGQYLRTNTLNIRKLSFTNNITIKNVTIEGRRTATVELLLFWYASNVLIDGVHITQGGDNGVRFNVCVNVKVVNSTIENLVDDLTNSHTGYGVHVSNSTKFAVVSGNIMRNIRHGFTTTGGTRGIPRMMTVTDNVVENLNNSEGGQGGAGIDTHVSTDGCVIANNTITNCGIGITVRGRDVLVTGNKIKGSTTGIRISDTLAANVDIMNNTITGANRGVHSSDVCKTVNISNNFIQLSIERAIFIESAINRLLIKGNAIRDSLGEGIVVSELSASVMIDSNDILDFGISVAANAIGIGGSGAGSGRIDIVNNRISRQFSTGAVRAVNASRATAVKGNTSLGSFTASDLWRATVGGVQANQTGNNEYV